MISRASNRNNAACVFAQVQTSVERRAITGRAARKSSQTTLSGNPGELFQATKKSRAIRTLGARSASTSLRRQDLRHSSADLEFLLFHVDFVRCRSTTRCREKVSTTSPSHNSLKE